MSKFTAHNGIESDDVGSAAIHSHTGVGISAGSTALAMVMLDVSAVQVGASGRVFGIGSTSAATAARNVTSDLSGDPLTIRVTGQLDQANADLSMEVVVFAVEEIS